MSDELLDMAESVTTETGEQTKGKSTRGRKAKTEQSTMSEAVATATDSTTGEGTAKPKRVKRVQVSVYLMPETYSVLLSMSSKTHESVSDIVAKSADNLAKKNFEKARMIEEALKGIEEIEY